MSINDSFLKTSTFPIPKIIHLTYKSKEEILPEWKDVILSWEKTNPTWKIIFWSDKDNEQLVKDKFPWFYYVYKNLKYNIQRADAIRCCYLFEYGGLYIDMDYLPLRSIDNIFYNNDKNKNDNQVYLTLNTSGLCMINSFMASKPKSDFWLEYLRNIMKSIKQNKFYFTKHFEVFNTTGPLQLTKTFNNTNNVIGLINPAKIHPCDICDLGNEGKCSSIYLKKIKGQSWNSFDTDLLNWIYCNKVKSFLIFFILLFVLYFYLSKSYICKYSCKR